MRNNNNINWSGEGASMEEQPDVTGFGSDSWQDSVVGWMV